jgi:hypothetical protein
MWGNLLKTAAWRTEKETGDNNKMYFRKRDFKDETWTQLAQDHIQWWAMLFIVLDLQLR